MTEESEKTEGTAAPAPEVPAEPAEADDALALAQREAADARDRALRALAELENYRRRADKERQDTAKYAVAAFARDVLPVVDNLRRGLDTVTADVRKAEPGLDALAAGVELTERELLTAFERHGIVKVDPKGEAFDPNLHQAMMEIEDASVAPGTVVQVMQAGYTLHDRLLRPALVGVAKGGSADAGDKPKPVQAPIANEDLSNPTASDGDKND
jgi:molecular chaperone GrpE